MSKTTTTIISELYSLFNNGVLTHDVAIAAFDKTSPSSELKTIFALLISGVLTVDAANAAITKIDSNPGPGHDRDRDLCVCDHCREMAFLESESKSKSTSDEPKCQHAQTVHGLPLSDTWTIDNGKIKHRLDGPALTMFNATDGSKTETWFEHNKMHRFGGPAYTVYNKDGKIVEERWYENNSDKLFKDGPMRIIYEFDCSVTKKSIKRNLDGGYTETWTRGSAIDNVNGYMAVTTYNAEGNKIRAISYIGGMKNGTDIEYYCNGKKKCETFFINDKPFAKRDNPTHVTYYENGTKKREIWHNLDGQMHRITGPALILYHRNGSKKLEIYYVNGLEHCERGPADICYKENGTISRETYVVCGSIFKGRNLISSK